MTVWSRNELNEYAGLHIGCAISRDGARLCALQPVVHQGQSNAGVLARQPLLDGTGFFVATMSKEDDRKWILIVDDDSSVRLMLARVLSEEGYGVLTAASGVNALDLAATMTFDLILLDLNMPGTNGWEALEELDAKHVVPPVIIVTAMPHQQAAARAAGVEAVLEKPLDFPSLIQTVSQVLAKAVNSKNSA